MASPVKLMLSSCCAEPDRTLWRPQRVSEGRPGVGIRPIIAACIANAKGIPLCGSVFSDHRNPKALLASSKSIG